MWVTRAWVDSLFVICSIREMELAFKVVEVVPTGDRIIATADNLAVARAAFDTAVSLWPGFSDRAPSEGAGGRE